MFGGQAASLGGGQLPPCPDLEPPLLVSLLNNFKAGISLANVKRAKLKHRLYVCVYTVMANKKAVSEPMEAKRLGMASIGLSVGGIVVTFIVLTTVVVLELLSAM